MENWNITAQINELPIIKDITFWHLIAATACGLLVKFVNILIGIVREHLQKTEDTLEKVSEILNSLVAENKIQEHKIETHEKRITKLEGT
jgi:hypothetical protein